MAVQRADVQQTASATGPVVSVVVIGLNEGVLLTQCLLSVQRAAWQGISHECIYVDSQSTDESVVVATRFGASVQVLADVEPSAAKARNLGLICARGDFVMFLDGDSTLDANFVGFALSKMTDARRCAVTGRLREMHPDHSIYNKVIDLDWIGAVGEILFFGGNAFVRRSCLLTVGGFDVSLRAGEEPELCARLREQGWVVERFDVPMAHHDLAMDSFCDYWRRAFRSGFALSEVAYRTRHLSDPLWQYEVRRDLFQGLLLLTLPFLMLLAWLTSPWLLGALLLLGYLVLARSVARCAWKSPDNRLLCWQYAIHTFFCKIPAALGQVSYYRKQREKRLLVRADEMSTDVQHPQGAPRMAYLVSLYPATSHTFILQEIEALRALGQEILTVSINPAIGLADHQNAGRIANFELDHAANLEAELNIERQASHQGGRDPTVVGETNRTFYVKTAGYREAFLVLRYWSIRPLVFLRMFGFALALSLRRCSLLGLAYALEAAIIARWMHQHQLNCLHVHFGNAAATVGVLVKRLTGCHLSLSIHGPDEFDDVKGQHLALKVKEADTLICISQYYKAVLMRLSPPEQWVKLLVCRLGVDTENIAFAPRQNDLAPLRLLCVGRLVPAKCQVLLVQACAQLRERGHDFVLTLVGAGPDQLRLEQAIVSADLGQHVVMTGALTHPEVLDHFASADIFVLPSLNEGIPVVLMEAMSCGVPCVSTPINGIPELIEHNQTGLLAMQGDLGSLVQQLARLMTEPELRRRLALRARQKVVQDFNLKTNVLQLSQIFQSFASASAQDASKT